MLYEIGYTHKKNDAGELISGSIYVHEDKRYSLTCAKLTIEQGKAGTLTLGIPYSNPAREEIDCLTDEIYVREKDFPWKMHHETKRLLSDRNTHCGRRAGISP